MYEDQFTYNCSTFEDDLLKSRKEMFLRRQFADVTLVSDDMVPFPAHRTVLSSSSNLLRCLFEVTDEPRQVLFLKGVSQLHLQSILKFIYLGETSVRTDQLEDFSAAAKELGIEKLMNDGYPDKLQTAARMKQDTKIDRKMVEKLDFLSPLEETSKLKENKVDNRNLDFLVTKQDSNPSEEKNHTLEEYTEIKAETSESNCSETKFPEEQSDDINSLLKESSMQLPHYPTESEEDKLQEKTGNGEASEVTDTPNNIQDESKKDLTDAQKKRKELYLKRKPEEPTECIVCAKVFTTLRSMQRHHKTVHELVDVGKYKCEECGKILSGRDPLKLHIKSVHRNIKFKCDICGIERKTKVCLKRHKELEHPLPYCDSCKIQFNTIPEFDMHVQKEHIEKYCK